MPNIAVYIQAAVIVALIVFVLVLSGENTRLTESLEKCNGDLSNANLNLNIARGSIEYQNSRVRAAENESLQMLAEGEQAEAEAEQEITTLQERIAELRRAPKAASCEAIRVKLLRNAGVHL